MGRNHKFTQKEFIERHIEFLKNYSTKYKFQDLDFRMVMLMSGCSEDEFQEHMEEMAKARRAKEETQYQGDYGDVDEEDSDWDSFSRGDSKSSHGEDYDDANEY